MGHCTTRELGEALIRVDGRLLAVEVTGHGPLTVVLETGLGAESAEWAPVQRQVEAFARVFRYDRAGRGASDPAPGPRTAMEMIGDLHELLGRTAPPPYLLVGHAFGGLLMKLYAACFPREVAGLLLVDPMHENQFEVFAAKFPRRTAYEAPELTVMRWFWTDGWRHPSSTPETIDLMESLWQCREAATLGDLPMTLLAAGTGRVSDFAPLEDRSALQELWRGLHRQTAGVSTRSRIASAPLSDHFIQRHDPQAIVEEIRSLAAAVTREPARQTVLATT